MDTSTRGIGSLIIVVALSLVGSFACSGGGEGEQTDTGVSDGGGTPVDGGAMDTGGEDGASDADTGTAGDGVGADGSDAGDGGGAETDTGRPSVYGECRQTCERARDCGLADEWVCEDSGYCDFHQCNEDIECVRWVAQWTGEGCEVGDCQVDGDICIQHNGTTYCAGQAPEGACERTNFEAVAKQKADGSGEVEVCAPTETNCQDNTCERNRGVERLCRDDSECDGLTCNDRDRCACESDQQCIDANRGDNWECLD